MTPDLFDLPEVLLDWLHRDDHAVNGWDDALPDAQMHCLPELAELLESLARQVGGITRVWVVGCPVLHAGGTPIAYARTGTFGVRSGEPAGALATTLVATGLEYPWVQLEPYGSDIAFTTARQLQVMHMQRARDRAEAGVWP